MSKKPKEYKTYRSPSGRYLDMPLLIADARKARGSWFLAFPAAPRATFVAIRNYEHRDLQALTDGAIEVDWRSEYIADGQRHGDVYVRFITKEN